MADKRGKKQIFTFGAVAVFLPYILITHMGPTPVPVALVATALLFVLGNGRFVPAMAMMTSTVRKETRGSFMSISSSVQMLGTSFASFIAGVIVQEAPDGRLLHYNYVGYLAVLIGIMAIYFGRKLVPTDS